MIGMDRVSISPQLCVYGSRVLIVLTIYTFQFHLAGCLVQRSGWTRDIDNFLQWLSAVPFSGGGFNDAAIAEGLSEALMVCHIDISFLVFIFQFLISSDYHFCDYTHLRNFSFFFFFFPF